MELEDIKKHWEEAGKNFPKNGTVTPTSRDPYLTLLERENILRYLETDHVVLEIGFGDGVNTLHYSKKVKKIFGIDIAESLVDIARRNVSLESAGNVDLSVGSALDLKKIYQGREFDSIISQRCLINLSNWDYQKEALRQAHSLLKNGGLFLLTEGFQDEFANLNGARQKLGLSEMKVVSYNNFMMRKEFEDFATQLFDVIEIQNFGTYLFLSRAFHPLAVLPEEPRHDSKLNEAAVHISRQFQMSDFDKYSYESFYALRKK